MEENNTYPKILIISHNPFSNIQNNGKTLSSFFLGWPKDKIAQLYLTLDKPDTDVCDNFYRLTDVDVLKQFVTKRYRGRKIDSKELENYKDKEQYHQNKLYMLIRYFFTKRLPILYCIRNLIWKLVKPWKNKEFKEWIKNYNPDVVFFQSSSVHSVFDMVEYICEFTGAKLYMETTDDYVTKHFSLNPFYWIDITTMIKKYKKLIKKSICTFVIGDMMKQEYEQRFGGNYEVAMNSIEIKDNDIIPYGDLKKDKILLVYAGNLGLNRWKILQKIGRSLSEIKNENNLNAKLEIYSIQIPNKKIKNRLFIPDVMEFKGFLSGEQLVKKKNEADILVHVEAFDRKNKNITRLSVSTKIPEYLLSERCILAIGPKEIASIKYINENNIGKVIVKNKRKIIKQELEKLLTNYNQRKEYIYNGKEIARKRHSIEYNRKIIQDTIKGL